jgi:hypothetical protein
VTLPAADSPVTTPLLPDESLALLREALRDYTVEGVHDLVGPVGQAALDRGDIDGVRHALPAGERLATLVELFLLGGTVPADDARPALGRLSLPVACAAGLLDVAGSSVRSLLDIRPYTSDVASRPWWVVSDFGSDVRRGPLAADYVLGVGEASLTLAQATIRDRVGRALDVGTGCGVQSLHLSEHADRVVATDISARALRLAATTAALSGCDWDLRRGSMLDPVVGEQFDLIVANPPFVVSPGLSAADEGYEYRDSGLAGDAFCAALVAAIPERLTPGGVGQLLANWIIPSDGDWEGRLRSWLAGAGCDAWVWQREVVGVNEYVALWLRDAGETPGTARWSSRYRAWLEWFEHLGVPAVGMGMVTMWRTGDTPIVTCEDVPQAVEQPVGAYLGEWVLRQRWLASSSDAELLATALRRASGVVRAAVHTADPDGWHIEAQTLRQTRGACWEIETDDAIAALVAGCDGTRPLSLVAGVLAGSLGLPSDAVAAAVVPTVRDLVSRGFLVPAEGGR